MAIGGGTDVAVEAGDVILVRDDPRDVAVALKIGRRIVRQIRQNLAWAFAYNVVLIPLAALGVLYPVYAGIAMAMSSISVTGWSLTLARYRPWPAIARFCLNSDGAAGTRCTSPASGSSGLGPFWRSPGQTTGT